MSNLCYYKNVTQYQTFPRSMSLNKRITVQSGPALGMFEVFSRTGPPTLGGGGAILDPKNSV